MDLNQKTQEVVALSREVGKFIAKEASAFDRSSIELKGLNDLVSYVDKEAEKLLVKGLRDILPQAGFVVEEATATHQDEEYIWIVDPLDGTTNFIHGLPVFAISIALMRHKALVMGVVYEINRDECFYAHHEGKAYMNGQIIQVSPVKSLGECLLATGFPYYNFSKMQNYLDTLNTFMQQTHGLRRMGSAAIDLVYVACGRFEGFFEYNLRPWDVAGGAFIVLQAGGTITDFKGGNNYIFGKELIAGNVAQPQMLEVIKKHW